MNIETPTGTLYGTLKFPQIPPPYPAALIISGSGPTDRDGNSPLIDGANDSLKLLAAELATEGIASLRFDKRGVGESVEAAPAREADLRFDMFVDDAVAWGNRLLQDTRLSSLTIIGHSEGSLIGMIAARRLKAQAFISIAGVGSPASQLLLKQLQGKLPEELESRVEAIITNLADGKLVTDVPPELMVLFRPDIQPYLISWFRHDPAREIAQLAMPVTLIQGTTDLQVSLDDAGKLHQANQSARLVIVEGMNHVLKDAPNEPEEQLKYYSDPSFPLSPALVDELSGYRLNCVNGGNQPHVVSEIGRV